MQLPGNAWQLPSPAQRMLHGIVNNCRSAQHAHLDVDECGHAGAHTVVILCLWHTNLGSLIRQIGGAGREGGVKAGWQAKQL